MELDQLAQIVDDMIIQHDYPGFEPRALRLGLPEEILRFPTKVYVSALGHSSVYVRLAALRWFQERAGLAKSYLKAISGLLQHEDEFVRMEAARTIERMSPVTTDTIVQVSNLLKDEHAEVRKVAAKAVGKLSSRAKDKNPIVLEALRVASSDSDPEVRMKVQKAVRLIES